MKYTIQIDWIEYTCKWKWSNTDVNSMKQMGHHWILIKNMQYKWANIEYECKHWILHRFTCNTTKPISYGAEFWSELQIAFIKI